MRIPQSQFKSLLAVPVFLFLALSLTVLGAAGAGPKKGGGGHQKPGSAWREDFSSSRFNPKFWVIANGPAPGYVPGDHLGVYDPLHVSVVSDSSGSYLQLLLTQEVGTVDGNTAGTVARGAMLYTTATYGYGTYEMRMRMSSTSSTPNGRGVSVSGTVSAGFLYVNNSETEIDFEFSGLDPNTLYMVNWLNPNPSADPDLTDRTYDYLYPFTVSTAFHDYKFVWQAGRIDFYVDGILEATHTTNVPTAPAYFMINHWGTDSPYWGGTARVGTDCYFYVDWVQYTPLP